MVMGTLFILDIYISRNLIYLLRADTELMVKESTLVEI